MIDLAIYPAAFLGGADESGVDEFFDVVGSGSGSYTKSVGHVGNADILWAAISAFASLLCRCILDML